MHLGFRVKGFGAGSETDLRHSLIPQSLRLLLSLKRCVSKAPRALKESFTPAVFMVAAMAIHTLIVPKP